MDLTLFVPYEETRSITLLQIIVVFKNIFYEVSNPLILPFVIILVRMSYRLYIFTMANI
jgi:hypothetical protein